MTFRNKVLGKAAADVQDGQEGPPAIDNDLYECDVLEVLEPSDDSNSYKVTFGIRKGCATGEKNAERKLTDFFVLPDENHKDGGKFCETKILLLGVSAGLITADEFAKGKEFDPTNAEGKVVVLQTKKTTREKDGEKRTYCNLDGLKIYHPEDARLDKMVAKIKGKAQAETAHSNL